MIRIVGWLGVALIASLLLSCARHVVVEREAGRVDGAKSISSMSDEAWTIEREPEGEGEHSAER